MLSEKQVEQRRQAGKASYRKLFVKLFHENTKYGETNWPRLAERLSCFRWNWGFRRKTGLTSEYVWRKAQEYGLVEW